MAKIDGVPMPAHDRDLDQLFKVEQPRANAVVDIVIVVSDVVGRRRDLCFQRGQLSSSRSNAAFASEIAHAGRGSARYAWRGPRALPS